MTPWIGAANPRDLGPGHFLAAAERLRCDPAAVRAVWDVEAAGRGFRADGSVERRFEPHHFPQSHWAGIGFDPGRKTPWRASLKLGRAARERAFAAACALDLEAALRASSWGGPQIMGFNAPAAGFLTAYEMVEHMAAGAPQQLGAFVQLVEGWGLQGALRARDWLAFARRYNGSGQPEEYARRIEAAYRRHAGHASPVVLRVGDRGAPVRELQRALDVEVDGAFGPATLAAVRDFQAREGLVVDGVVGAMTWVELQARENAAPPPQPTPTTGAAEAAVKAGGAVAGGAVILDQIDALTAILGRVRAAVEAGAGAFDALAAYGPGVLLGAGLSALAVGGWVWWRDRRAAT